MRKYKHCLFFLLDGARPDVLGHLLSAGDLPNIHQTFIAQGTFRRITTVFPSTTGAAYLPFLTGRYPGHCNIPGIRWFDRKAYADRSVFNLRRFRSYVGAESYLFNRDLSREIKTIFDHVRRPVNIFNPISRGSGFWGDRTRLKRSFYALYGHYTGGWRFIDRCMGLEVRAALKRAPDFLFAVFPGVDEMSHLTHPFSAGVFEIYRQFDRELGRIRQQCERLGMLDETLFMLASDHGMTATHTHFDLAGFMEEQGFETLYYPKIFKKNFDVAVMQSGNAMAHLYLKSAQGWHAKTYREDMEKLIESLSGRPEVAWVAALDRQGAITVRSKTSEAWIRQEGDGKIRYQAMGGDPFGFKNAKALMTDRESLDYSFDQPYPDAFRQLLQLFKSERTGDLVVNAAPGYDLRSRHEWPEHFSSHGSLIQSHMHVPWACSHRLLTNKTIRSVDIFPTLLSFLDIPHHGSCDGTDLLTF